MSSNCNGNGECLTQCECECYNEETDEYNEICVCGHREHNGNCTPYNCCQPVECRGCKIKLPLWVSQCHNGMCMNCAINMGPHKKTEISECCVCFESKNLLELYCKHKLCNECWFEISTNGNQKCPLCRNLNVWGLN
jgi:hypothetical protein